MAFVTAVSTTTGRKQRIPEHFLTHPGFKGKWKLPPSAGEGAKDALPEGEPTEDWTRLQLDKYAADHGIDVTGASTKADVLTAIAEHDPDANPGGANEEEN